MKNTGVESVAVSIPLSELVAFATRVIEKRDHAVTSVRTDDRIVGVRSSLGYGRVLDGALDEFRMGARR